MYRFVLSENTWGFSAETSIKTADIPPEDQLIRLIRRGEMETVDTMLDARIRTHAAPGTLISSSRGFVGHLVVVSQKIGTVESFEISPAYSPVTLYGQYLNAILRIRAYGEYVAEHRSSHSDATYERIRSVLHTEMRNPELSLSLLSEKLGLSEYYVSRIIPNALGGRNFRSCVEQQRMEIAAQEIRRNPSAKTSQLMKACGYRNLRTFTSAFKRFYGVTPSVFRASH